MRARDRLFSSTIALLICCADPVAGESTIDDPARRIRETRLANGLTVLTLLDRTTPVVSFQLWVRVGSRDEGRVTGLAHLFEHMMFKGSKNVAPEQHARIIQARGGRSNAYTTNDVTVYVSDVTSEALPLVIALEAERIANLEITADTLERERQVVLEERLRRVDDRPSGLAGEALYALTFQAHPYRRPVIGWRSDIESATLEHCREFFHSYYVPNNMVIVIVGNFDEAAALAQIRRDFGGLAAGSELPRNPTREPPQRGARRAEVHFDLLGPLLAAAWQAPPSGHADAEALDVASEILSGGRSSRVYRRLIYDEQLALAARGVYSELADAGIFLAYANLRPGSSVARTERLLLEEIARLRDEPVTVAELDKAKRQLEASMVHQLTTNKALASRIGYDASVFGHIRPLEDRLAAIEAVTAADVQRVARTYLTEEGRNVVHVVRPPEPDASREGRP